MKLLLLEKLDRLFEHVEYYIWKLKKKLYRLVRGIYKKLPPGVSDALQGLRFRFIRWAKNSSLTVPFSNFHKSSNIEDISWNEFSTRVLSHRDEFKGIFIQENGVNWNIKLYQRPQHICTAFGRMGYLVIYRIDNWSDDDVNGFREVSENVWITNRREVEEIDGVVRSFYSTSYQLTPDLLKRNDNSGFLIYEYIDHVDAQISGDTESVNRLLKLKDYAFSGGADYVVASARGLENEAISAIGREKVLYVPNGVDTGHYRNQGHRNTSLPGKLISFKQKHTHIIGYFGAIAPWLWYDVIAELAELRTDLGFVFIGPDYNGSASNLPKLNNILYLGEVQYQILPAYAYQFDVCFIPFEPGEIARTTSPLKLFEYFALEKPVVVTSEMLECTAFDEVYSGNSAETLSRAMDNAIKIKSNQDYINRLRHLASNNDWNQRVKTMEVLFDSLSQYVSRHDS